MKILALLLICFTLTLFSKDFYSFDKTKLQNYSENMDLSNYIGIIKNQIWIYSKELNENQLKNLLNKEYDFLYKGYNKVYGLLVEFDDTKIDSKKLLKKLKNIKKIDNAYFRVYEGSNSYKMYSN